MTGLTTSERYGHTPATNSFNSDSFYNDNTLQSSLNSTVLSVDQIDDFKVTALSNRGFVVNFYHMCCKNSSAPIYMSVKPHRTVSA